VIWHIVRFDFAGIDDAVRADLEASLAGLASIDVVAVCHVVTAMATAFADHAALEAYRVHPEHVPVVEALRAAGVAASRLDLDLPDTLGAPA
jgi:hypothetical protein